MNRIGVSTITRRSLLKNTAIAAASMCAGRAASIGFTPEALAATTSIQPVPAGALTQASLTVTNEAVGTIPSAFAGLSYAKEKMLGELFTGSNDSLIGVFKRLGSSCLRLGGTPVDQSVWTPNGPGGQQGHVSPVDIDNLAEFIKATGWSVIYGVNLAGAATGATNPEMAAAEVAYAASKLGSSLIGIEIGNEPDFYGRPGNPWANDWSFDKFVSIWNEFRTAIVRRTPGVPITGPADGGAPTAWTIPFGEVVTRQKIDLLTQHYYRGDSQSSTSTVAELLAPDPHLIASLADLNAFSQANDLPFRIAECNSYYDNSKSLDISSTYSTALWGLDFMFTCARGGSVGVNFNGGGGAPGYSPLLNSANSVIKVCPLYYAMLLFTLAGTGTLLGSQIFADSLNVTGYAVQSPTGAYSLIVVNKDKTQNLELQIALPQAVQNASLMAMTQLSAGASGPDLMAIGDVTIQSSPVHLHGSFAPSTSHQVSANGGQLSCYVPALSAILVQAS
jgi:hypothetical protein